MATDLVAALRAEITGLETELANDPRFQKLKAARELLDLYRDAPSQHAAVLSLQSAQIAPRRPVAGAAKVNPGSQRTLIIEAAADYLRRIGHRAQTAEITKAVLDAGVSISYPRPGDTVSSALSQSAAFDNVRGQGYGLVEWSERPPSAGADSPQNEEMSSAPKGNGALPSGL